MNSKLKIVSFLGLALISVFVSSCMDDNNGNQQAHLVVRLTDAPGDYQEVNIDIQDVQVNAGDDDSGWKSLDIRKGTYDLIKLTNGLDTLLGETDLPAGRISQIRLILGNNNTVRVDNRTENLSTPSAQQSGLKVQVHADLKEGMVYEVLLDFDAARSIVATGNGAFKLKPVIRAIVEERGVAETDAGAIEGSVNPAASNPAVHVIQGVDTVSTMVDSVGNFFVGDLTPGNYRVVFIPIDGFLGEEVTGVNVTAGDTTNVGVVVISHL
jgi:hypothetical protein